MVILRLFVVIMCLFYNIYMFSLFISKGEVNILFWLRVKQQHLKGLKLTFIYAIFESIVC